MVTGPGQVEIADVPEPTAGPRDILVRPRACGVCGSDGFYISIGGIPPRQGATILGHEAAGEVVEVGAEVEGVSVGDHVVVNPMAEPTGIIGNGGASGALAELLVLHDAVAGKSFAVVPKDLPWEVAALNEPMAVARHAVNRANPKAGDKVVVFGAGPIGLGAAIGFKSLGASHVVVVDVVASRLERALAIGADAVINSAEEDVRERLLELHGETGGGYHGTKPGTDIYLDAAGVPSVIDTVLANAKHGATLSIPAVHKKPVEVDFGALLTSEITIVMAMGYPTEIFEVTEDIIANQDKYAKIISHPVPFEDVLEGIKLASTPGAADKVVITMG
ncbi:zinc-binding dehydrogenase [Cellulomonas cellasea]|uniref:zinc-dependent alcohol dehydrogenase n=1 Tax=Cellulomonas cellasea TaxID=43670 RepID=UPI0025A48513|nr:zinc-binding dehydrogenase [Cellulomonas cellasea]MDM8086107.1 zinc-binding dehydrogenase [Cellulomonas cellasea]